MIPNYFKKIFKLVRCNRKDNSIKTKYIESKFDGYIPSHKVSYSTWERYILSELFKLEILGIINPICNIKPFLNDIFHNYNSDVPFHNHNHILEVFQFGMCLLQRHRNMLWNVEPIYIETFCFALLLHDVGHTGFTNHELETRIDLLDKDIEYISDSSESSYASSYNEHTHVHIGTKLLDKHHISYIKHTFNNLIYITDLQHHDSFLFKFNPFYGNQCNKYESIMHVLKLFIKLSDIGHIIRPWKIHVSNVIKLNNERLCPLSVNELVLDTLIFNKKFVLPLLDKLRILNIGIYYKMYTYYSDNIKRWDVIRQYFEIANLNN